MPVPVHGRAPVRALAIQDSPGARGTGHGHGRIGWTLLAHFPEVMSPWSELIVQEGFTRCQAELTHARVDPPRGEWTQGSSTHLALPLQSSQLPAPSLFFLGAVSFSDD